MALHSVLDSPRDKILWDVGHQAYPHKVLTGRRDALPTIRQYEGLAPFCAIHESEHDIMGAGHASTAIGYAVGLKEAMRLRGEPDAGKVVAVVGDGAMTGGVAFEAIHQAGGQGTPIVVVLNDNGMSIAPNVGALSSYFNRVRLNPKLWHAREGVEERLADLPGIGSAFERLGPQLKESIKAFWAPGLWWEELDWAYVGVIDGHDVRGLRRALRHALVADRPVVVHVSTVKGKGFAPAEDGGLEGMERWHAAKPKSIANGVPAPAKPASGTPGPPQYTSVFGNAMVSRGPPRPPRRRHHRGDELRHRPEPAPEGRARPLLRRRHRRAAGRPVRRRPGARGRPAGLRDLLDLPAARLRPDRPRRLPAEAQRRLRDGPRRPRRRRRPHPSRRLRHRLHALPAQHRPHGPARRGDARPHAAHGDRSRGRPRRAALPARRGRRRAACPVPSGRSEIGTGEILREGAGKVALVGYGSGVGKALEAADLLAEGGLDVTVADARFAKPIDAALMAQLAAEHELLVTVEEGVLAGGFGSAVWETLSEGGGVVPRILRVGLPDRYVTHGKPALLHAEVGFTGKAIAARIEAAIGASSGALAGA